MSSLSESGEEKQVSTDSRNPSPWPAFTERGAPEDTLSQLSAERRRAAEATADLAKLKVTIAFVQLELNEVRTDLSDGPSEAFLATAKRRLAMAVAQ